MKNRFLLCIKFLIILVGTYIPSLYSQDPTYTCTLTNDVQTDAQHYQFDVYILRTGITPLILDGYQIGLTYNLPTLNGGTMTAAWTNLDASITAAGMTPSTPIVYTTPSAYIKCPIGNFPPNSGVSGPEVTNVAPGLKFGTLVFTNSVNFAVEQLNIAWMTALPYPTKIQAYVTGLRIKNITTAGTTDLTNSLINGALPVELNSFTSNVSGRQVELNWETKTEVNSSKFEIERAFESSKDAAATWVSVGVVQATGSSNSPKKYSFTEKDLKAGKYQYRLKMIDNDGSYKYSSAVETEILLPKGFELNQNYPNPFNPSTVIDYQVPVDANVILEVYNVTGQKVVELVNREQTAGYYSVSFGSSSNKLASGVYIYRISATEKGSGKNFSTMKKMMLLK